MKDESDHENQEAKKPKQEPLKHEQQFEKEIITEVARLYSELGDKVAVISKRKMPYYKLAWRLSKVS